MNYQKHYTKLIERAKVRSIIPTEYKEKHHIVPRSMGGSDEKDNLVDLLPEEHLVAHLLLTKMYPDHEGLLYGAFRMSNYRKITNKKYAWLRTKFAKKMSEKRSGTSLTTKHKENIGKAISGENNGMFGKNHTEEVKKKQSILVKGKVPVIDKDGKKFLISKDDPRWINGNVQSLTKGRKPSEETKKKFLFDVTCPHCGKVGKNQIMKRWHFDKCKHKK